MRQREYRKHPCAFRNDLDETKRGLAEVWRVLREIQDEQLRQGEEMRQIARELRQPHTTQGQRDNNLRQQTSGHLGQQASETVQPNPTRRQQSDNSKQTDSTQPQQGYNRIPTGPSCTKSDYVETVLIPSPIQSKATVIKQIVVAGGGSKSYEIFDWSTQQWTLHEDTLFFDHTDGFSFVYDNKIMICGGTRTNKVECLDISNHRSVSTFSAQLVDTECGKGVLCGDRILTFGESVSGTSLKPPFKTTVISYSDRAKLSHYGVACVNENTVVVLGGYYNTPYRATELKEDVLLYNPTTKGMKKLAPLPHQLADMAVVVRDDNLIVLGGHKNHDYTEICSDVLMYNITKQQCSKLPSMLENR
jgi:hypothetical protein